MSYELFKPSKELADVIGDKNISRTEAIKKFWSYVKKEGLQDSRNSRYIKSNPKLKPLFDNRERVSIFDLAKILSKHLKPVK